MNRFAAVLALSLTFGVVSEAGAGWHHRYHRSVAYVSPVLDYAPYSVYGGYSVHGPAVYHRSYYAPVSYGYRSVTSYGWGRPFARPFAYGIGAPYRYGFRGVGFTRYGVYGGSYAYAPLTVGYPYSTGYLSVVRPVQPYLAAYRVAPAPVVSVPVTTAYAPCVYGAYGLLGY